MKQILPIFFLVLIHATAAIAVEGRVAGWGCYCGTVIPPPCSDAACKAACGYTGGGSSGSGSLGAAIGSAIGRSLVDWLFSAPDNSQRLQELEQQRQLEQQREAELERLRQEQYQRLMGSLKGIETGSGFKLKGVSDSWGLQLKLGESAAASSAGDLPFKLKTGDETSGAPADSAIAQLQTASFLSQKAAEAQTPEDAKALADAAFQAAIGGKVPFETPQTATAAPVDENLRKSFEELIIHSKI